MAGHSKWANIKRRKAAVDARRSKVWTKVIKEIQVAAKMGGGDPDGNPRLRLAIDKARGVNVPKDSIKRAIEKGTGGGGGADYEDVTYEGYGPSGVAVIVEFMTDNRNRTVGEVRHAFERFGGNMGAAGSVGWMFKKRGVINVLKDQIGEDALMELALEHGAEDLRDDGEVWTIDCEPAVFLAVKEAIESASGEVANAEVDNIPDTRIELDRNKAETMFKLLDVLEDLDDVQNVYANHEVTDEILEELER